jgi:hypothetical protein
VLIFAGADNTNLRTPKQMSRKFTSIAAFAVLLSFATFDAQAFPLAPAPSGAGAPDVTLVAGGCGPLEHRGPLGHCRPNAVVVTPGAVVVAPPVVVAPVVCGPGLRWHPRRRRCWAY